MGFDVVALTRSRLPEAVGPIALRAGRERASVKRIAAVAKFGRARTAERRAFDGLCGQLLETCGDLPPLERSVGEVSVGHAPQRAGPPRARPSRPLAADEVAEDREQHRNLAPRSRRLGSRSAAKSPMPRTAARASRGQRVCEKSMEAALSERLAANEAIDEQAAERQRQAEAAIEQQERIIAQLGRETAPSAPPPQQAKVAAVGEGGDEDGATSDASADRAAESTESSPADPPTEAAHTPPSPRAAEETDGVSGAVAARYQAARLQVVQEELEKLRGVLAAKEAAVSRAEASARDSSAQAAAHERTAKGLRAALEKERAQAAERTAASVNLESELRLLRAAADESARTQKAAAGEQRGKDVRLNRALEELEKCAPQQQPT